MSTELSFTYWTITSIQLLFSVWVYNNISHSYSYFDLCQEAILSPGFVFVPICPPTNEWIWLIQLIQLVGSFMKWVPMAEQPHTSLSSPCTMPSFGWSGVKLAAIGLWSSGNVFSGVMNHTSASGSPTDESGCGGCQENATYPNA